MTEAKIDFTPPELDLVVVGGVPASFKVTPEPAYFASLGGAVWEAHVRKTRSSLEPELEMLFETVADGVIVTIPSGTEEVLDGGRRWHGVWDLRVVLDGVPSVLFGGSFTIERGVTR